MVNGRKLREREITSGNRKGIPIPASARASGSTEHERPVFTFHHMSTTDFCVTRCQQRDQADVALALERRAQFTWGQLRQMRHQALGWEYLDRDAIRATIPAAFTEDQRPMVFRIGGDTGRMVGFRQDAVFHVVWIDVAPFALYAH